MQPAGKNQTWQLVMSRGKRYTVHEYNTEDGEASEEDENFQFKDQAELEKITEEGYGKDYEDGLWEEPVSTSPSAEATTDIPEDYDSADYENKRAEVDSGSAEERSEEPATDYDDYDEAGSNESGRTVVGRISGETTQPDEFGFPVFKKHVHEDDFRRWSKRDTFLAQGPEYDHFYADYVEAQATTRDPKPVLTTTEPPTTEATSS